MKARSTGSCCVRLHSALVALGLLFVSHCQQGPSSDLTSSSSTKAPSFSDERVTTAAVSTPSHRDKKDADVDAQTTSPQPPPVHNPEADRSEAQTTYNLLRKSVQQGAQEDGFPWVLAHGLLAFGAELRTTTGELASHAITRHASVTHIRGKDVFVFPAKTSDGRIIEAHPGLMVASLVASELPLDTQLPVQAQGEQRQVPLSRLVRDAEWAFQAPENDHQWLGSAWLANMFFSLHDAHQVLSTVEGELRIMDLAKRSFARLEYEQAFLGSLMDSGRPDKLEKKRQGIYRHSCGGFHLAQSALHGAALLQKAAPTSSLSDRIRRQLDILRFRWQAERVIYRRTRSQFPKYRMLLLVQELKFFGHLLETMAFAAQWELIQPTGEDRSFFRQVVSDLAQTVRELGPIYAKGDDVRKTSSQTYNDLIGDGCHAVRALNQGLPLFYGTN